MCLHWWLARRQGLLYQGRVLETFWNVWKLLEFFGNLLNLVENFWIYHWKPLQAGYPCEENYNPADHYIWELSVIEGREIECEKKIDAICNTFDNSAEKKQIKEEKRINDSSVVKDKINQYNKNSVNFLVSFYWLLWRSLIAQYRDKSTIGMKFGQNLGTALIVGLVYLRVPWGKLFEGVTVDLNTLKIFWF